MIVPDGIVQAEGFVALAPAVTGAFVAFDDDGRHPELAQPGAKRDAALAAADDQRVWLVGEPKRRRLILAVFLPGFGAGMGAVQRAERAGEAGFFLMAFQLDHGCEQGPDQTVLQSDETVAARDFGLEADPCLGHAAGLARVLAGGNPPVMRFHAGEAMGKHVAHLLAALDGFDVPGEGDEVAPRAFRGEKCGCGVNVAGGEGRVEAAQKGGHAPGGGGVEHVRLSLVCMSVG